MRAIEYMQLGVEAFKVDLAVLKVAYTRFHLNNIDERIKDRQK